MDYRHHLITILHKNTSTEFWVFWSHGVFLATALTAVCNNCSYICSNLYTILGMIKKYYGNVILERTVFRQFCYQFSMHSYANLELHKCHLMLMICNLVKSFSFLNGLTKRTCSILLLWKM